MRKAGLIATVQLPHPLRLVGRAGADGLLHGEERNVGVKKEVIKVIALELIKNQSLIVRVVAVGLITL